VVVDMEAFDIYADKGNAIPDDLLKRLGNKTKGNPRNRLVWANLYEYCRYLGRLNADHSFHLSSRRFGDRHAGLIYKFVKKMIEFGVIEIVECGGMNKPNIYRWKREVTAAELIKRMSNRLVRPNVERPNVRQETYPLSNLPF
jgi:hypothetical protein